MARGVNKVILLGNVGKDPEIRYMPSGGAVASLSLATSESWTDKNTGEKQERTEWHRLVIFGKLAEIAAEYVTKGMQLYIEGSLRTRKWQDKEGRDQYTTEVVVNEMQMIGGRREEAGANQSNGAQKAGYSQPSRAAANNKPQPNKQPATYNENEWGGNNWADEDIPF